MTTQTPEATDLRKLAERYGEAWKSRDLDAIMDLHTEDCVFVAYASDAPPAEGKAAVRDAFAGYIAMMPDLSLVRRALPPRG
jgi:uncharacterized protein (TIGR02246 family)